MRLRIIETAISLFDRDGFDAVTMERIAEAADVAKATLYSYFPAKEAVLVGWMQLLTADLGDRVETLLRQQQEAHARIKALFFLIGELIEARRSLVERYVLFRLSSKERFCGDRTLRSGIDGVLRQVLAQGQAGGEVRRDLAPEELTTHLESLFLSTLMMWFAADGDVDLEKQLDRMLALFFDGCRQ